MKAVTTLIVSQLVLAAANMEAAANKTSSHGMLRSLGAGNCDGTQNIWSGSSCVPCLQYYNNGVQAHFGTDAFGNYGCISPYQCPANGAWSTQDNKCDCLPAYTWDGSQCAPKSAPFPCRCSSTRNMPFVSTGANANGLDYVLCGGCTLYSSNYNTWASFQSDCNLVIYRTVYGGDGRPAGQQAIWASNTYGRQGCQLVLQTDSNLVIYDSNQHPVWAANGGGRNGQYSLVIQNDGNLVVYDDAYETVNGVTRYKVPNNQDAGVYWAASFSPNFPFRGAFSPLEPNFAVSFACTNSGSWRWNNYGGNSIGTQVGIFWDSQPAGNELFSFHVGGFLGTDKVYAIVDSSSDVIDYNGGNGLTPSNSRAWPFIITCENLSSDQFTGDNCIISAFAVGCVQNTDAATPIVLGYGGCGKFNIYQNADGFDWFAVVELVRNVAELVVELGA